MKKYSGLRLLPLWVGLTIISAIGQAQNYTPFNFKNGQWICGYDTKGGVFSSYGSYYIKEEVKFYCEGDTVISDTLYNKLYYEGYAGYPYWAKRKLSGYIGPIRNDTLHRQIWFGERLLYDFNLQLGDSVGYSCSEPFAIITSIDSVLYCDKYHRRFNFKDANNYDLYLIEGIGSIFGLLPVVCLTSISWLSCYSEKGNPVCDTCQNPTRVDNIEQERVQIYPNPTNDRIWITSAFPISSIEILDLLGRQLYFNSHVDENEFVVEIRERGVFFVRVMVQGQMVVRKIVRKEPPD